MERARFAPSTTGPAHPGTLLAALLCWLDARSRGAHLLLRLEDLDPERSRPSWCDAMREALDWLGLDWDEVALQSRRRAAHAAALDRLAGDERLYPCRCTRRRLRERAPAGNEGGLVYPGTCRLRSLPPGGWRAAREPLRVRLPDEALPLRDESGSDLSGRPARDPGDPIVLRRDGAVAYHLASVVDDAAAGVTRVVRGRDLASTSATQVALQRLLGLATPAYRHHLLLLEARGEKLAKLHGAVGFDALRSAYTPETLCGWLAFAAGLRDGPGRATPRELLSDFAWSRVRSENLALRWTGSELRVLG